ncbi:MAG: hypothetical protein M3Y66_00730 [Actinomycetota bacterium]|nr:hypothetical protein [Actinomycetota bacterium]
MFTDYYAKVNDDYRRELLTRSWARPHDSSSHPRRFLPHLPSALRARHAA